MAKGKKSRKPAKGGAPATPSSANDNVDSLADHLSTIRLGSVSQESVSSTRTRESSVLQCFFTGTGLFAGSMHDISGSDRRAAKLARWQSILSTTGVCDGPDPCIANFARPEHFPPKKLPLPTSLNACSKLIKEYLFVNIINFRKSQMDEEALIVFSSTKAVAKYTKRHKRIEKLESAKADFLNPLLRSIFYRPNRRHFLGVDADDDDYDSDGTVHYALGAH